MNQICYLSEGLELMNAPTSSRGMNNAVSVLKSEGTKMIETDEGDFMP